MKRTITLLTAVMFLGGASALRAMELQQQRMNLNLWGNGITSAHGHFGQGTKTVDVLQNGASFGLAWQYFPLRSIGIQVAYEFGAMNFEKGYRVEAGKTPAFEVHQITVSGIYNFADLISSRIRPFVSAGIGLYPFRVTADGISGDTEKLANGNKFDKTSFGLNGGVGVEVLATNHLSAFGGLRYHYLFAKDDNKFGANANFGDQALLSLGLGLSYHFPMSR